MSRDESGRKSSEAVTEPCPTEDGSRHPTRNNLINELGPILDTIIDSMEEMVALIDRDSRVLKANPAALRLLGMPPGSKGFVLTPDIQHPIRDPSGRRLETCELVRERALRGELVRNSPQVHESKEGRTRHYLVNGYPIRDGAGQVTMALIVGREVTDGQDVLTRTREALDAARKHEKALQSLIDNMPAGVLLLDSDLRLLAWNKVYSRYFDPSVNWRVGVPVEEVVPLAGESGILSRMRRALETGRAVVVREFPYEGLRKGTTYWRGAAVPLHLRLEEGQTAALALVAVDVTDEVVAREKLAQLAALAGKRAAELEEVYRHEHAVAEKLQTSFLIHEMPRIEGFDLSQRYQAALDEALVGGDFFDVFRLRDNRLAVVIADVAGKGLNAAVYTAMTKYMLRAYALEESAPELVLARLNEALAACTPAEVFVTLVYGVLDGNSGTFAFANAGHEHPVLYRRSARSATTLDVTGRALALVQGASYTTMTVQLESGDTLVLYTDGITDAGTGLDRLGQDRLLSILESHGTASTDLIANALLGAALEFAGGRLVDDAALVVIGAREEGEE